MKNRVPSPDTSTYKKFFLDYSKLEAEIKVKWEQASLQCTSQYKMFTNKAIVQKLKPNMDDFLLFQNSSNVKNVKQNKREIVLWFDRKST